MKKLLTLALAFVALATVVSCGGDEEFGENELVINGVTFPITFGTYYQTTYDFTNVPGRFEESQADGTHIGYVIYFTDDNAEGCTNCNYYGALYLVSKGNEAFNNGSFDVTVAYPENIDENTESFAFLEMEINPEVYEGIGGVSSIAGGKIKVSGEAPNFTITFNFEANVYTQDIVVRTEAEEVATVKGQFKGQFEEQTNR